MDHGQLAVVTRILIALVIWQALERTRLGLLVRATSQNAEMVHALGIDVNLVRSAVFGARRCLHHRRQSGSWART